MELGIQDTAAVFQIAPVRASLPVSAGTLHWGLLLLRRRRIFRRGGGRARRDWGLRLPDGRGRTGAADGRPNDGLVAVRTPDLLAEALAEFAALAEFERVARAGKRILSGEKISNLEGQAHAHAGDPVPSVDGVGPAAVAAPVFDIRDDRGGPADFRARLPALEAAADAAVVLVVAGEDPGLDVFVEAGDEEAGFEIESVECAFIHQEAGAEHRGADAAVGMVPVEPRVEPFREHFRSEAELVEVIVILRVNVVVENIAADDDVVAGHEVARAEAGAEEELMVVIPRPAQGAEKCDIPRLCEGHRRVEESALEVVAELSTHGERACGKGGFGGFGHLMVSDLVSGKCGDRDGSGERNGN